MPKYRKHEESDEKFLKNFDDFCIHTIKIMKDENVCPKSARWLGAGEIVDIVQKMHTSVHRANSVKVLYPKERELRHTLQINAYSLLSTLGEKFEFNTKLYDINVNKLNYWLDNKGAIQKWLSSWIRGDEERYKDI